MKLYIPVGISGSGKTIFQKSNLTKTYLICPDDLRQEFLGDASNQSADTEIWLQAYDRLAKAISRKKDVYFSSTNLSIKAIEHLKEIALENVKNFQDIQFIILDMTDSLDENLCRSRVKADLENHIVRSNTLKFVNDLEGNQLDYDYVHKQYLQYLNVISDLPSYVINQIENNNLDMVLQKVCQNTLQNTITK